MSRFTYNSLSSEPQPAPFSLSFAVLLRFWRQPPAFPLLGPCVLPLGLSAVSPAIRKALSVASAAFDSPGTSTAFRARCCCSTSPVWWRKAASRAAASRSRLPPIAAAADLARARSSWAARPKVGARTRAARFLCLKRKSATKEVLNSSRCPILGAKLSDSFTAEVGSDGPKGLLLAIGSSGLHRRQRPKLMPHQAGVESGSSFGMT